MKLEEFLKELEKYHRGWKLNGEFIRKEGKNCYDCPISHLARKKHPRLFTHLIKDFKMPMSLFEELGKILKLDKEDVHKIVDATDNKNTRYPELRQKLLKVFNLKEK